MINFEKITYQILGEIGWNHNTIFYEDSTSTMPPPIHYSGHCPNCSDSSIDLDYDEFKNFELRYKEKPSFDFEKSEFKKLQLKSFSLDNEISLRTQSGLFVYTAYRQCNACMKSFLFLIGFGEKQPSLFIGHVHAILEIKTGQKILEEKFQSFNKKPILKSQFNISQTINTQGEIVLHKIMDKNDVIDDRIIIRNKTLSSVYGSFINYNNAIIISDCTIEKIAMHGITAKQGLQITDCKIGHLDLSCSLFLETDQQIILQGNIFSGEVSFEDVNFKSKIEIIENDFQNGCDLMTQKQLSCFYPSDSIINGNKGDLEIIDP